MKAAIISLGGKSSVKIAEEGEKYFSKVDVFDIRRFNVEADKENLSVHYNGKEIRDYDCVYLRGSHKYYLLQRCLTRAMYNSCYMPIKPEAFTVGHNKLLTLLELQKNGIRVPRSYFAGNTNVAKAILKGVAYPIIIKIPYGTQGKGVMFADSQGSASSVIDAMDVFKQPYIIQEYIDTDATDVRAFVIGKDVIAMRRRAIAEELRANIHMGGKGEKIELDDGTKQIALKCAKVIGAEVCAVDILEGVRPSVIEVNLSPGVEGITKATRLNIAEIVARYLFERTKEFESEKGNRDIKEMIRVVGKGDNKEIYTNVDIKNRIIRLPKYVTDVSKLGIDDEVVIKVSKGKIEIIEQKIKKED